MKKLCWRQVAMRQDVVNTVNVNLYWRSQDLVRRFYALIFVSSWESTEESLLGVTRSLYYGRSCDWVR